MFLISRHNLSSAYLKFSDKFEVKLRHYLKLNATRVPYLCVKSAGHEKCVGKCATVDKREPDGNQVEESFGTINGTPVERFFWKIVFRFDVPPFAISGTVQADYFNLDGHQEAKISNEPRGEANVHSSTDWPCRSL